MPRAPRILAEGATYHLMAHANEDKQSIFMDDADRATFLELFGQVVAKREWTHLSHCLMTTHFHLVATTHRPTLAEGMRDLLALYARQFNRRHKRAGRLFRDRYLSVLIEDDRQLLAVLRYVAWNPVDAHIVETPHEWRWSSYAETMGGPTQTRSLDVDAVLALLHRNRVRACQFLRETVEDAVRVGEADAFLNNDRDGPSLRTLAQVLTPNTALVAAERRGFARADIARELNLTRATVGRRLSRLLDQKHPNPSPLGGAYKNPEFDPGTGRGVWSA